MSGKSNTWQAALLNLVFTNVAAANIGSGSGLQPSSPAGSLYVSLHTADPTNAGSQNSSEAGYTGYARVAVARDGTHWTISGTSPTQVTNALTITFPQCTGGSSLVTYIGVGTSPSGAGELLYSGQLTSSLAVSQNITPAFAAGACVLTED